MQEMRRRRSRSRHLHVHNDLFTIPRTPSVQLELLQRSLCPAVTSSQQATSPESLYCLFLPSPRAFSYCFLVSSCSIESTIRTRFVEMYVYRVIDAVSFGVLRFQKIVKPLAVLQPFVLHYRLLPIVLRLFSSNLFTAKL